MKGLLVLFLLSMLAGCGDFEWFPDDGTTTTTTTPPPTTPTQNVFNNVSTVSGPTLPAVDATSNIKVTAFTATPDKTTTTVTVTFTFDIGNFDTVAGATAVVTVTALDNAGDSIQATNETVVLSSNSKRTIQTTATALSLADYDRIRSWKIVVVKQ